MRPSVLAMSCALFITPALADDRRTISAQMQELADAVAPGNRAVWDKYLDASVIYAEEDDTYKGKAEALEEIKPLPQGLSGSIVVAMLSYHEDEDVAIALFRQKETENYFGQTIHANYLTSTTWRRRANGWKLVAEQVLAEKSDPPAIILSNQQLIQYSGSYRLKGSETTLTLSVSDGALDAQRSGIKTAVLTAEACDVFFVKGDPRIRKIFQRDATGKVIGFVERREMWDIVWVKSV